MLTAVSTVLGMIPIAPTVFWGPMAFAIMGGLLVGTILTLVFLPTLYVTWFGWREARPAVAAAAHSPDARGSQAMTPCDHPCGAGFFGFWLILTGLDPDDLPAGLAAAAIAARGRACDFCRPGIGGCAPLLARQVRAALSAPVHRGRLRRGMARARSSRCRCGRASSVSAAPAAGADAQRLLHRHEPAAGHAAVRTGCDGCHLVIHCLDVAQPVAAQLQRRKRD